MKRFTLRTKRAQKVLALTLAAALVIPAVPGGLTSAEAETGETPQEVTLPEVIASESFDDASSLNVDVSKGKQIKFTSETATSQIFDKISTDGVTKIGTFQSVDKVPAKDAEGNYEYEDINVAPEVVTEKAVTGGALELKAPVTVAQFPSKAPDAQNIIQEGKTYYSAAEITNPFADPEVRKELYDADSYTTENIAKTATALDGKTGEASDKDPLYETDWDKLKSRKSRPEAKTGVTISFWAKTPVDKNGAAVVANYLEFYNTESLVYKPDDLMKNYIANLYKAEKAKLEDDADFDENSPFYVGKVAYGTVVGVGSEGQYLLGDLKDLNVIDDNNSKISGSAITALTDFAVVTPGSIQTVCEGIEKMPYIVNQGMYMTWNPKAAENDEVTIVREAGKMSTAYIVSATNTNYAAAKDEIVVDSGKTDKDGKTLYYHLKEPSYFGTTLAYPIYHEDDEGIVAESYYAKYVTPEKATDYTKYGTETVVTKGNAGCLYLSTDRTQFLRDFRGGEVVSGPASGNQKVGTKNVQLQNNVQAQVHHGASWSQSDLREKAEDGKWHYITLTITNDWFQTYVDGVAIEGSAAGGKNFNQCSGMYQPNGKWIDKNTKNDWQKVCNGPFDWLQGNIFGTTVMDFITDANTKLYVGYGDGSADKNTVAGTMIDEMVFYKEKLDADQVKAAYDAVADLVVEVPEAVSTITFSGADDIVSYDGTTGAAIKFTAEKATQTFVKISTDGVTPTKETYQGKESVPVTTEDGKYYVREGVNAAPVVTNGGVNRGNVLELKDPVKVAQFPSKTPNSQSIIQEAKTYYSAAQIKNPFTEYRDDLYNEVDYLTANIAKTATALDAGKANGSDPTNEEWARLKSRYSRPEAKTGVTISFWAKTPVGSKGVENTNYLEFYNTESLVYKTDNLIKNYIANLYKAEKAKLDTDKDFDKTSPFYVGEVEYGTVVGVGSEGKYLSGDLKALLGLSEEVTEELTTTTPGSIKTAYKMPYLANQGMYMTWNPKAAESEAAIVRETGKMSTAYIVSKAVTDYAAAKDEIVVDSGKTDKDGNTLYYHLKETSYFGATLAYPIYQADEDGNPVAESDYAKYVTPDNATELTKYGTATVVTQGNTGRLAMSSKNTVYQRDPAKVGTVVNSGDAGQPVGTVQQIQSNTFAQVWYAPSWGTPEIIEDDEEWHYITMSLTDEWFQIYVDGVALNPSDTTTNIGNTFNQGSGMYKPDGTWVNQKASTDWKKVCNGPFDWLSGAMFGTTVMDFITDENTKLYVGGIDQATVAGTQLDSFAFYTEALDSKQVAKEYDLRKDEADPTTGTPSVARPVVSDVDNIEILKPGEGPGPGPGPSEFKPGDVNHDGKVAVADALSILMYLADKNPADYHADTADCDESGKVAVADALDILMYLADKPSKIATYWPK